MTRQGNLARDLDWAVRERELNHAGEALRHEAQAAPKIRRGAGVRAGSGDPLLSDGGVEIMAVIAAAVLSFELCRLEPALAADAVTLKSQLTTLRGGKCWPDSTA
ncbi:MAG: hypothetical protein V8R27_06475 [Oscillospiraceae bacterium]